MHQSRSTQWKFVMGFAAVVLLTSVAPAQAAITSITPSNGSTLGGATQVFSWTGTGNNAYWFYVGTTKGAKDIFDSGSLGLSTSTTVNGLPTDGSTVYVRLWYLEPGTWKFTDYTYTAFTTGSGGGGGEADNHTLRWDRILDSANGDPTTGCDSDRFKCIFGGAAVLDLETGLVWERSPDPAGQTNWQTAHAHCVIREVGGRLGWSLPMLEQLASLVDRSNSDPVLPTGHPFLTVQSSSIYWAATSAVHNPSNAWSVDFSDGDVSAVGKGSTPHYAWCVRGGQSFDGNTHNTLH